MSFIRKMAKYSPMNQLSGLILGRKLIASKVRKPKQHTNVTATAKRLRKHGIDPAARDVRLRHKRRDGRSST
jgi:hypothetical protein